MPMLQMQGSIAEVKLDIRHRDGRTIPIMMNAIRRHRDGAAFDQISVTVADERNKYERELLNARKRADELVKKERDAQAALRVAQRRLGQALTGGALFIWGVDARAGRRTYGDEVACLLGHAGPRPVDEDALLSAMAPEERAAEQAMLDEALKTPGAQFGWKYTLAGIDGKRRVVAASGQSFFDEDGSFSQFVGILQDITAHESLRAAAEDRALFAEQMVGIVSHDLRNPLSAILIGGRLLAGDIPVPEDRKARLLVNVVNSAERAQRLIAELLDFTAARVGSGLTVDRQPLLLHDLVEQVVDELALAFPGRRIVHRRVGEGPCRAAPDRLAQVLGNLVGNAHAYGAPDSSVTVTSTLQGDRASVSVHNFGPPIPASLRETLFEPMVRGGEVGNSVRSVGLGLFIVKAIAQAHGGVVRMSSSAESGTEFSVAFPSC
jgi:sigma-B regulation protein RsbU (phosphoserine phosphatase)